MKTTTNRLLWPLARITWTPITLARIAVACLVLGHGAASSSAGDRLVVHEWGTFTALQDDDGSALAGINVDDEPLPAFVHNLSQRILAPSNSLRNIYMKGVPQRHPYVTLRLETPVVYFYPPAGEREPLVLDVHVDFRGGWLTQFYPQADAVAPGLREGKFQFGTLSADTRSSLDWRGLTVGTQGPVPQADSPAWNAPRQVRAARVTAESGESERYLFYRGVGNFPAPLAVVSDRAAGKIQLKAGDNELLAAAPAAQIGPCWLVEVRADRQAAFRVALSKPGVVRPGQALASAERNFAAADFSPDNIDRLSASMHGALTAAGLYDDEATAMLATWRQAYFCSPGLRLFFVVPRAWTDRILPLRISRPCDVERVMVARLELISPAQRDGLKRLSHAARPDLQWLVEAQKSPNFNRLVAGRSDFGDLGVEIPPDFQAYLGLGRFRDALVIAEHRQRPSDELTAFVNAYGLWAYRWPPADAPGDE